jgi:ornithine cyclodeaminase
MGSDARGKYELDPELVAHADLYADVVEQSVTLGDFELALSQGLIDRGRITSIGAVINGVGGRKSTNAITIYDSSGMALQDLVVAELALRRAQEQQLTTWLPLQGTSS